MEQQKQVNNIDWYRKGAVIVFLLVAAFSIWKYTDAYSRHFDPLLVKNFAVSGEAKMIKIPDIVEFTFSVITEGDKNLSILQRENTDKMNTAIVFLKNNGVKEEDIKTQQYNIVPRYKNYYCSGTGICPPPEIVGYTITQSVLVRSHDFEKVGELLSGIIKNGANSVSELRFALDDPSKIEEKAREEAIKKAREKANMIAKAGNFKLGKLLSIEEGTQGQNPIPFYSRSMLQGVDVLTEKTIPQIQPGTQESFITITLRYEIND